MIRYALIPLGVTVFLSGPMSHPVYPESTAQVQLDADFPIASQDDWEDALGFSEVEDAVKDLEAMLLCVHEEQHQWYKSRTSKEAERDSGSR